MVRTQKSGEKSQIRKREQESERLQAQKKADDMDDEINQLSSHSKPIKKKRVPEKLPVEVSDSSETDESESESESEGESKSASESEEEFIPERAKKKEQYTETKITM